VELAATLQSTPLFSFAPDQAGGVIVAYLESGKVMAARIAGDGSLAWNGSALTLAPTNVVTSQAPVVAPDGLGGAFIAWATISPRDVHVQHVTKEGTLLWPAAGAIVPDGSASEREMALVDDGEGGIYVSFATTTSLRGQRLNADGIAQWTFGTTNGVSLQSGFEPSIGRGVSGPIVVYSRSFGLGARLIDVPQPAVLKFTRIELGPTQQPTLTLSASLAGTNYAVLRASHLGAPLGDPAWVRVGTIQPGGTWSDPNPPQPMAVYVAGEGTP
jgi:hypothetical protein